jgi:hypothetical protein
MLKDLHAAALGQRLVAGDVLGEEPAERRDELLANCGRSVPRALAAQSITS